MGSKNTFTEGIPKGYSQAAISLLRIGRIADLFPDHSISLNLTPSMIASR